MKYNKGAILRSIEQPFMKDNIPAFDTGDSVRVDYKVAEGNRTRIQAFEGVVIARQNGKGARASFTVRKVSFGEGVERVFPLHSPLIDSINVVRRGRTRRAKLYYLRELRGKKARLKTDIGRQEVDRVNAREQRAADKDRKAREAVEAEAQAKADAEAAAVAAQEAEAQAAKEAADAKAAQEAEEAAQAKAAAAETSAEAVPEEPAAEADAAPQGDDLTRIEGIGPKYADALKAAGITTFAALAKASEEDFQKAASDASMSNAASMATWNKQAQYLVDGDEAGLKTYQDEMIGGKEA